LFYGEGYFLQRLDQDGWQQEEYLQTDVTQLPMELAIGKNGEPVVIEIETRGGSIRAKVWRVKVGRCDLLLLDSKSRAMYPKTWTSVLASTAAMHVPVSARSCSWAVGGFRALKAMGITPGVLHLNEGHSGFAVLEAVRDRMQEEGLDFDTAANQIPREVILPPTLRCRQATTAFLPI